MVETETRIALLAQGLDAETGLMHSTRRFRSGLAHDLMEPLRPLVDAWMLELLGRRVFSAGDFVETRQGIVRLVPPLPQALAAMAPVWMERALPLARWLAAALERVSDERPGKTPMMKPLPALPAVDTRLSLMPQCRSCGRELRAYRQKDCADCAVARRDTGMPAVIRGWTSGPRSPSPERHRPDPH